MSNKVTFGLKNVYYAKRTNETTYGTPVRIPGAVEISLEPKGEGAEFYADDVLYYSAPNNQGYDGTLTIANIPEQFAIDCLGETKDNKNVILEKSSSVGSAFALLFEFDGDVKATRHVLYNCTASRPTVSSATRTNSKEPNTNELTFVAAPKADGVVKGRTSSAASNGTDTNTYNNWYTKVYVTAG